jgi:hypothetical protein
MPPSQFITQSYGKKASGTQIFPVHIPIATTPPAGSTLDIYFALETGSNAAGLANLTSWEHTHGVCINLKIIWYLPVSLFQWVH